MLAMPVGMAVMGTLILVTRKQTLLDYIIFVTGCCLCLFHIIWTFVLIKADNMGWELLLMSMIGKLILVPLFVIIIGYAVGLISTTPLFERATISDSMRYWIPYITAILVVFIHGIFSFGQMFGVMKMYSSEIIMLWETVVYASLSWLIVWDIFSAALALIRHYIYRQSLAAEYHNDE